MTIFGIFFLLSRFQGIGGFSLYEVLLNAAIMNLSFALSELFARGFDNFSYMIGNGQFDRILLRPKSIVLQVLASQIEFSRIGRVVQALLVFAYILPRLPITWDLWHLFTLLVMILATVGMFCNLFFLVASLSFFTLEGLEVMNILTDGGREFGQYPFSIYGKKVLKMLTYCIPLALVQYYPFLYLIGKSSDKRLLILPILAQLFVLPVYLVWKIGLNNYQSTGS